MTIGRRGRVGMLVAGLLAGCAVTPLHPPADSGAARCLELYAALDNAVADHGKTPSSPGRIAGFPYLRVDRFLAAYRERPQGPAETAAWLTRLNELDQHVRQVEWDSLPVAPRAELIRRHASADGMAAALRACAIEMRNADLADSRRLQRIRERARVPDDYSTLNQVLGLYPLTALAVAHGVSVYHEKTHALFAQPLAALPVHGELRRYGPPAAAALSIDFTAVSRDALGIPEPNPDQLDALFAIHAPVWEIDTVSEADRPGAPYWRPDGTPSVDPAEPVVYRYVSHVHWRHGPLLQLNYLIWFSARPRTDALDILGGSLDGVLWRVTLDRSGRPLLYDSIHACGCYHLLFPTAIVRLRAETAQWAEPPLAPQAAPAMSARERIIVRLASGSHYLQRVYAGEPGTVTVPQWRDYAALYAVPAAGSEERRSLFGRDGLVAGSERAERWLLWPTGVPSPGAMRERGRHAIAFVGRRHFDDADLLERLFEPAQEGS